MKRIVCNRCGCEVKKEPVVTEYPFYCGYCDENLYEFETHEVETSAAADKIIAKIDERLKEKGAILVANDYDNVLLTQSEQEIILEELDWLDELRIEVIKKLTIK